MRKTRYFRVLLRYALARVDHDYAHVRALYCHLSTHDGEFLDSLVDPALAADAGSVDKHIFAVFVIHLGVDRIARCSGDIADYDALLTEDVIYKRGLTDVRLADNGDLYAVVFLFVFLLGWEILHALIQKIARSVAVDG